MTQHIQLHQGDIPDNFQAAQSIAIDTEAMGLNIARDRLCLVQVSNGDGRAHLVKINLQHKPKNLIKLLTDNNIQKIFHFARFDVSLIYSTFSVLIENIYCTKIASRLCRTYTDKHSLKDLCKELLSVDLNKQEQTSDWGAEELKPSQMEYAAQDVLHLHALRDKLNDMLVRENRVELAQACFRFLPVRAVLDAYGFESTDVFAHT